MIPAPDLEAMRRACAEADELLGQAVEIMGEPLDEAATPAAAERLEGIVGGYIALAGVAIERFDEAARGREAAHGA